MSVPTLKEYLAAELAKSKRMYLEDLAAMSHDQLDSGAGGASRTGYDMTYEVVLVNKRILSRLKFEEPTVTMPKGWTIAPVDFRNKDVAMKEFESTMDALIQAWDALPEDQIGRKIETAMGDSSPYDLVALAGHHAGYHDAQLNYLQAIHEDQTVHWSSE